MSRTRQGGFTLIEMMITVAVIGILAAIAFPSYQDYIRRANRSAAQSFMMSIANKQQQYLLDARTFAGDKPGAGAGLTALGLTLPTEVTGKYTVGIVCTMPTANASCDAAAGAPAYTITATAEGAQAQDTKCVTLTVTATGAKGAKNNLGTDTVPLSSCW